MLSKNSKINNILVVSLSNIGDIILTCPVIDVLKNDFPNAKLSVIVGPKGSALFEGNPVFDKVIVYDKHEPWWVTAGWVSGLRKEKFDLALDLRNTAIPFFVGAKLRAPLRSNIVDNEHMKDKHLRRLRFVYDCFKLSETRYAIHFSHWDDEFISTKLGKFVDRDEGFAVIAPGAANHLKRWTDIGYREIINWLWREHQIKSVIVGDLKDKVATENILLKLQVPTFNLCGELSLVQLGALIKRSVLIVSNDSAPMHYASYLNKPVMAIFGPSDPRKYGPWSEVSCYVQSKKICEGCQQDNESGKHTCMTNINSREVLQRIMIDEKHQVKFL